MATTLLDKENLIPKAKKAANVATVNNTAGAASTLKPVNVPASVAQALAKSAAAQAQAKNNAQFTQYGLETPTATQARYNQYINEYNNQAKAIANQQVEARNQAAQKAQNQNYINYMMAQKAMPEQMARLGLSGGATESSMLRQNLNYQNLRGNTEAQRAAEVGSINQNLANNLANYRMEQNRALQSELANNRNVLYERRTAAQQQAWENKIRQAEQVPVELDFEIPENMSDEISKQKNSLDALVDALVVAETEKIKFANVGDMAGVAAMTEQIERLSKAYDENSEKLETNLEKAKRISEISKGFEQAGQAVGAFGDMFSALGDATDDAGLKVMGIIAQAIATITLSFAQALTSCKTWIDWLIFGVTGMSTMITMIAQIKQLTAGSYAQGGIIPGSSYHGDILIASVNSGEMILNTQQQNKLLNIANGIVSPANGNYIVNVQGKIKGTDIILVSKNTNKLLSKSGTNISF